MWDASYPLQGVVAVKTMAKAIAMCVFCAVRERAKMEVN